MILDSICWFIDNVYTPLTSGLFTGILIIEIINAISKKRKRNRKTINHEN